MENIQKIEEYISLIDSKSIDKLYKVFDIFNQRVEISESEVNIYNFHKEYLKEIKILEEFGIIEYSEDSNDVNYKVKTSQMEMAKINNMFMEKKPKIGGSLGFMNF